MRRVIGWVVKVRALCKVYQCARDALANDQLTDNSMRAVASVLEHTGDPGRLSTRGIRAQQRYPAAPLDRGRAWRRRKKR